MPRYDAFLSYSHAADGALAPALQKGLQRLARPWNRRRAMEVFRDQTGLSATPHLWGSITAALDTAEWFVLLASPESAASEWVGKEIEYWMASGPEAREHMLAVVTGGEWEWTASGFTRESTAAHPALREAFDEEPLFVDLRWVADATGPDLADARFREAVASIAAPIRGESPDDLIGEDVRQFRLARRVRRAAVAGLAALALAAAVASVVALDQRNAAVDERDRADQNATQSRARELAALAETTMSEDAALAVLLAVEANYPNGAVTPIDVPDAHRALGMTLRNLQWSAVTRVGPRINARATHIVHADEQYLATVDATTCICDPAWWDATTGEPVASPQSPEEEARMLAPLGEVSFPEGGGASVTLPVFGDFPITEPFTVDPTTDLLIGSDPATFDLVVQPNAGGPVMSRLLRPPGAFLSSIVSLPSGQVVALSQTGELYQWSLRRGGRPRLLAYRNPVRRLGAVGEDRIVVETGASLVDSEGAPPVGPPQIDIVDISDPGRLRYVGSLADPTATGFTSYLTAPPSAAAPPYLAARSEPELDPGVAGGRVDIWDLDSLHLVASIPSANPTDLVWLDPTTVAVASARGVEEFRIRVPPITPTWVRDLATSADGSTVATLPRSWGGSPHRFTPPVEPPAGVSRGVVTDAWPGGLSLSHDGQVVAYRALDLSARGAQGICPPCVAPASSARVANLATNEEIAVFPDGGAVAFDPTGNSLAVGVPEGVLIVDVDTWDVTRTLPLEGDPPSQIVWTADGAHLLIRTTDQPPYDQPSPVQVIDALTGASEPAPPRADTRTVAISPDGRTIATARNGGAVELWDRSATGTVAATPLSSFVADLAPITGLAFSPDGRRLATSGDRATIWDLTDRAVPRLQEDLTDLPALSVVAPIAGTSRWGLVAFDPDGTSLVLAGPAGILELADDDPALACALVSSADLEAAERVLGAPSACRRVPELEAAAT